MYQYQGFLSNCMKIFLLIKNFETKNRIPSQTDLRERNSGLFYIMCSVQWTNKNLGTNLNWFQTSINLQPMNYLIANKIQNNQIL